ncbi:hypothetical protein FB639_005296, partial [Coemansia asiatica]
MSTEKVLATRTIMIIAPTKETTMMAIHGKVIILVPAILTRRLKNIILPFLAMLNGRLKNIAITTPVMVMGSLKTLIMPILAMLTGNLKAIIIVITIIIAMLARNLKSTTIPDMGNT